MVSSESYTYTVHVYSKGKINHSNHQYNFFKLIEYIIYCWKYLIPNKFIKCLKIKNQIILNHTMANTEVEDHRPVHHNPMPIQYNSVYNMVITKFWPDHYHVWAAMMK